MTQSIPTSLYIINNLGQDVQNFLLSAIRYLPKILWAAILIIITLAIANYVSRFVKKLFGKANLDKTAVQVIGLVAYWIVVLIGLLMALSVLGLNGLVASIVAGAGFTSVIIAFGTQDISKNVIAGAMIIASRQFKVGDNIIVTGGHEGVVRKITLRAVVLEATDGRLISVPSNVIFSNVVTNLTSMGRRKVIFDLNVKTGMKYEKISKEIIELLVKQTTVFKKPSPEVLLSSLSGKYYTLTVSYWTDSSPMMQRRSISEINNVLAEYLEKNKLLADVLMKKTAV